MRHRKDGRQFSRDTPHRRAMFRNLAGNLITHERIVTTDAKAKELRRVAERLITKAKRLGAAAHTPQKDLSPEQKAKRLHVARLLGSFLPRYGVTSGGEQKDLVEKVLVEMSKRFEDRAGGYTRIIKLGPRKGDGASMAVIEFVDAAPPAPKYEEASIAGSTSEAEAPEEAATEAATDESEAATDESAEAEASDEDEEEKED